MMNTIQTNMINYVDANGKIVFNELVTTIQVRSADDLALLTGFGPGTRAYLADESKMWIYGADGQWSLRANSGGGGDAEAVFVVKFTVDEE